MMKFMLVFPLLALLLNPALAQTNNESVDYPGFSSLVSEVDPYRQDRLIDLDTFLSYAEDRGTIILDSRSAAAFQAGHIEGAINIPFSDFTQDKLDRLLGDKSKRILIYCNNNFSDNVAPVMLKRVELALNIPTFINLYGYGYKNLYELNETISIDDPRIEFVGGL